MKILYLVGGAVLALVILQWMVRAFRMGALKSAAARHGLQFHPGEERLSAEHFELHVEKRKRRHHTKNGTHTHTEYWTVYRQTLTDWPEGLTVTREGVASGRRHAAGQREWCSGETDFDDFFWVETPNSEAASAYLTPSRQTLLLHALYDLPEASVNGGDLVGQRRFRLWELGRTVDRLRTVARMNDRQPAAERSRGLGWVNRMQRNAHASSAMVLAFLIGIGPGIAISIMSQEGELGRLWQRLQYGKWSPALLLALAPLPLVAALLAFALGLFLGIPGTPQLGRWLLIWLGVALGLAVLLTLIWLSRVPNLEPGTLLCTGLAAVVFYGFFVWMPLDTWRASLLRLRCGSKLD